MQARRSGELRIHLNHLEISDNASSLRYFDETSLLPRYFLGAKMQNRPAREMTEPSLRSRNSMQGAKIKRVGKKKLQRHSAYTCAIAHRNNSATHYSSLLGMSRGHESHITEGAESQQRLTMHRPTLFP